MGGIIKFALFVFLAMAFFTPEETNALKCIVCSTTEETDPCFQGKGDSTLCKEMEGTPPSDLICVTTTSTVGKGDKVQHIVSRSCANWKENESPYKNIAMGKCEKINQPEGMLNICICHVDGCNSGIGNPGIDPNPGTGTTPSSTNSVYLTGWTMFQLLIISFGVIIHSFTQ